jgi:hypothetical protein
MTFADQESSARVYEQKWYDVLHACLAPRMYKERFFKVTTKRRQIVTVRRARDSQEIES